MKGNRMVPNAIIGGIADLLRILDDLSVHHGEVIVVQSTDH